MFARALLACTCVVVLGGDLFAESAGGCLSKGVAIPTIDSEGQLLQRIDQICTGKDVYRKSFLNRERCLPKGNGYLEFNLYPGSGDKNRIVQQKFSNLFYFTDDHYRSFYEVQYRSQEACTFEGHVSRRMQRA